MKTPTCLTWMIFCFIVAASVQSTAGQNLILNGSFESPTVAANTGEHATPTPWTWSSSVGFVRASNGSTWPLPQNLQQYVDIGNSSAYALSQTITITNQGQYLLSWFDNTATPPSTSQYSVRVLDASAQMIVSTNLDASHSGQWRGHELYITLAPGDYTFRFQAQGNGNSHDTLLDNVSLLFRQLPSGTAVSGTIVNKTWTSNNSPYLVVGDIVVAGLTIQPGVTVLFAGNYVFEVGGVLKANGTVTAPIVFMGTNGGWQGIFFNYSSPGSVLAYCVVSNSVNSGIRILNSNPTIKSCVISSNSAQSGGGINANIQSGNLTITDSMIANNSSYLDIVADRYGGGIYAIMGSDRLEMTACTISNNWVGATTGYGGAYGAGCLVGGDAVFENCLIISNSCVGNVLGNVISGCAAGGGIAVTNGHIALKNSILRGNTASGPSQGAYGGGLYVLKGSVEMVNCIVQGNVASPENPPAGGGGICIGIDPNPFGGGGEGGVVSGSIVNSTIAYNQTLGIAVGTSSGMTLLNSIVFYNGANFFGTIAATYCDIQGGFAGAGNINVNPIFLSTSDLIIVTGSSCIDKGNTNAAYNDICFPPSLGSSRNDMGAHGGLGAGARLRLEVEPQTKVSFLGGVPGYNYMIQASTNLLDWETVQQAPIAHVGDVSYFFEPTTNTLPYRFYKLNLAP